MINNNNNIYITINVMADSAYTYKGFMERIIVKIPFKYDNMRMNVDKTNNNNV